MGSAETAIPAAFNFTHGVMGSGKTDEMVRVMYNYGEKNLPFVLMKPSVDTKGQESVISRTGRQREVDLLFSPDDDLVVLVEAFIKSRGLIKKGLLPKHRETYLPSISAEIHSALHAVFVEEVQFATPEHIDQLDQIRKLAGISIMAYGLDRNFMGKHFPATGRIHELEDVRYKEIFTMCGCGSKATETVRYRDGIAVFSGSEVVIDDGAEYEYTALCDNCRIACKEGLAKISLEGLLSAT